MAIARQLRWSLGEVLYGKQAVYENGKGISDFERDLWFALWQVEREEAAEEEEKREKERKKEESKQRK